MSTNKAALKSIGSAIQARNYDDAVSQAQKLLANDPQHYQGNLFLGFAFDKVHKVAEAEQAYDRATKSKPEDPQAWQGLVKLYENQGSAKVDAYQNAATRLATIYVELDDRYKCQAVIDAFTVFAKNQGTRKQHLKSLEVLLPTSPVYDYLEGRIPHPSYTYQTIAQITEADEKERMNKEIGERRTRLGAKINQVTLDVRREIFSESPLEDIYSKIIDWSNDDDIRRQYEEKLLQRCYDSLLVLPVGSQESKRAKVQKLASDMVIIKHPFKLAWDISIEWPDYPTIVEWDAGILREYCSFFPGSGLAKVLSGYMTSEISPFPAPSPSEKVELDKDSDDSEDDDEGGAPLDPSAPTEDRLLLMTEGMSEASGSILAHRIMGEYYAFLDEHESVVELMRAGLKLIASEATKSGLAFTNSTQYLRGLLGTALVYYQSPKNHPEAKTIFEDLLRQNPTSTPALIGVGLIYEEDEDYPAAIDFLERALQRDPDNIRIRAEAAWVKAMNGDYEVGRDELESCVGKMDGSDLRSRELRAETQYRIGICIWNLDTSKAARKDRSGAYSYFLAALKSNMNFAPAYTSLGIFFGDYAKDKKRARKCFQKAFELSSAEVVAAERLAKAFAEQGDWELVEVVSQRVVDSGKVKPAPGSKKPGISWPFAALGVAELNKQDYAKSVASFQAALRISPKDYHSWVGLGESYHNSGRYIAATKAFTHAETFEQEVEQQKTGDTWFAKYMLANVKRELGSYDDAIQRYTEVLDLKPEELGVEMALIQTYVENAWDSIDKGLFGRSAKLATDAIDLARTLIGRGYNAFNIWKSLGDACSIFSWVQGRLPDFPHLVMKEIFQSEDIGESFGLFADIDGVGKDVVLADGLFPDDEQGAVNLTRCLHGSLLCHKRAIQASANDVHAQAVAYYNLGWSEYRAHVCLRPKAKKSTRYLKAAIRCFKRAIELEASNAEFWNSLGVVTSELSPRVAQHSFVRSLFLNERSAQAWTNLGTLALLQNDHQVANEAFTRAQSTDPEFGHAWVGQGLVALLFGDPKEARLLLTHAIEISDSSSTLTNRQYSLSTFDNILGASAQSSIEDLVQPIFALNQLQCLSPTEIPYQHLASLFLERVENTIAALSILETISTSIEADYEVTESPESLTRFALARADLARSQFTAGDYTSAIDSGETSLQLSAEDAGNELTPDQRQKCRLSAHLTVGLAYYHTDNPTEAVSYIEAALAEAAGNPDAICLLAQVLWATGSQISCDKATESLFDSIDANPGHVQSVLLLGTISLLNGDTESLAAVIEDLHTLRSSSNITDGQQAAVGELLRASAALGEEHPEAAVLREVQTDVFLFPNQPPGWTRMADLSGDPYASEMALRTAVKSAPPHGVVEATELGRAFAGTGKVGDAQRGVMFAPWRREGWGTLATLVEP
ncbi:hypothetical protein V500_02920 [Pseudogymnoascus sp. VKM F-4518 (FW-2643)]|nr:hypothetical protein V500_02920 [Pseudogymnoascus sp. VKM F-4518 (FW-2643)]